MTDKRREVEAAVLATYQKENPSTHFLAESEAAFDERAAQREALYRDCLKFPPEMFAGRSLLDLGAGTGENSVYYARWGARCTLVEVNEIAGRRAREVFARYLGEEEAHSFVCSSLFDYATPDRFDIVVCEGVVHHTADKAAAFARVASFLRPGGYVVLSVGNAAGCFQRALQRVVLYRFAQSDEEIVAVAERLFKEHIDRAARYGQRSRRAVIFDSFVNPKVDFPSVAEVLGWFAANGLRLYSTWPPVVPALLGDSGMRSSFDPLALPAIGAAAEAIWLAHDRDDAAELAERIPGLAALAAAQGEMTSYINDFAPGRAFSEAALGERLAAYRAALDGFDPFAGFTAKAQALLDEVRALSELLEQGDLAAVETFLAGTKHLFRGTGGLGITRFVGYRTKAPAESSSKA